LKVAEQRKRKTPDHSGVFCVAGTRLRPDEILRDFGGRAGHKLSCDDILKQKTLLAEGFCFRVPGTGTLHNSHICTGYLKWLCYRDENAQFDLNWAFFFFCFEKQPLFWRQNGYNLVTRVLDVTEWDTMWLQIGYSGHG